MSKKNWLDKNICFTCERSDCGGWKRFDPVIGPTISCPKYRPRVWSLTWIINWVELLCIIGVILCIIYALIARSGL